MKKILISACLVGEPCRYDGKSKALDSKVLEKISNDYELVPVCPEVMGGLGVPRKPCEIKDGNALTACGEDCTNMYKKGAELALLRARSENALLCILKKNSPSCSNCTVYDGSFSKKLVKGMGFAAELLIRSGFAVFNEDQLDEALEYLSQSK